jgi:hypothetical protein
MTANINGGSLMESGGQKIVLPARVETFIERRREKGRPGVVSQNETEVVFGCNQNNNRGEKGRFG